MDAKPDANGLQSGRASPTSERVESLLAGLLRQMQQQTDAINQLAASNMALVDVILDQIDDGYGDSAGLGRNYLDGSSL